MAISQSTVAFVFRIPDICVFDCTRKFCNTLFSLACYKMKILTFLRTTGLVYTWSTLLC